MTYAVHRKWEGKMEAPNYLCLIVSIRILSFPLGKPFVFRIYQSESGGTCNMRQLSVWETRNSEWEGDSDTSTLFPFPIF